MFDFIFLDMHMPIMDGNETVKRLREMHDRKELNLDNTKIIALSAITEQQFKNESYNKMFDSFIEKPVNFNTLKTILTWFNVFTY